jgi:outer membrane protein assembly factor BamB
MRKAIASACLIAVVLALAGWTSQSQSSRAPKVPEGNWPQFNYTAQRAGVGPANTGITARNLSKLQLRTVVLPGTADSSAIEFHGIRIHGRERDVLVLTTSYGHTVAIAADTGKILWEFTPTDIDSYLGSAQFTTATPTADPDGRYVYVMTPDGRVHKLVLATGRQVRSGRWPVTVTLDPSHEKLASPASIDGPNLIVVTDGYIGDIPPYQGHVVSINRVTGKIQAVFNSLCSGRHYLINPTSCPQSDSAIWGRSGAVIERNGDILVATANGESTSVVSFNGKDDWSDSVLEFSPKLKLLHNWTPSDQLYLTEQDLDLGSTSPALLPGDLAVQGGKSGVLSLLNLKKLDGTTGPAGPRTGGALQTIAAPGSTDMFSEPAVWTSRSGTTYVFATTGAGTEAYRLSHRRLSVAWQDSDAGTSPVIAGGLLYVYDEDDGQLLIRNPVSGRQLASLKVRYGHWSSPIVVGGRIILPVGSSNNHATTGILDIYHLPGR